MPSTATITAFYSFAPNTIIRSAHVNNNFDNFRGHLIAIDPSLAALAVSRSYDLGADNFRWRGIYGEYHDLYNGTSTGYPASPTAGATRIFPNTSGNLIKKSSAGFEYQVFDAQLFPTKGYWLGSSATYTAAAVAIGADGQMPIADSASSAGFKWAYGSGTAQAKTTTYTALISDDIIKCSGSAFTVTLPPASGLTGKRLTIVKTDSPFTNIITIDANSSETINGALTTTLNTQYESVTIQCDGSNWFIVARRIPSVTTNYTPSLSSSTNATIVASNYRREADSLRVRGYISWSGNGGGAAFTVSLPTDLAIDTAKINAAAQNTIEGSALWLDNGVARKFAGVMYSSSTVVQFEELSGSAGNMAGTGFASGDTLSYEFLVPISGWEG